MRRRTPTLGHEVPCTDPAYVIYLERQLTAAQEALRALRDELDSARAAATAAAVHNADLTEQVRELVEQARASEDEQVRKLAKALAEQEILRR